jgi:hypothetical protein
MIMSIQTRAGFKKEFLAFFRTRTFIIVACVIIGLSLFSPLMVAGLGSMMDSMSDVYDDMGMDVSGMTDFLASSAAVGMILSIEAVVGTSLIVVLLLLNKTAGGELKKRSVIIPKSAGLRSFAYIFPKFIIYPLTVFILAFLAVLASWPLSVYLFEVNDVTTGGVLLAGVLSGVSMMFFVCCHLALGTATGKAGMSAAVLIAASVILPMVFATVNLEYMFNPFALGTLASVAVQFGVPSGSFLADNLISIAFAFGIMLVTYLIALFAQNARKIDNSGDDIEL